MSDIRRKKQLPLDDSDVEDDALNSAKLVHNADFLIE